MKFNKIRVGFFHVSLVMDGRTLINQISQVRIKAAFGFIKAVSAFAFSFFFFFVFTRFGGMRLLFIEQ